MQAPGVQNLWIYRPERTPVEIRKRNNVHVIDAVRPDVPVHVYAHGFGCSQHMWRHITPAFEGKCRRSLQLARGRFAMLDDGKGFSLVPWKPVMEMRLGKTLTATVRGGSVS